MGPSGSVSAKSRSARNPVSASRRRRTDGGAPLRFSAAAGLPGGQVIIRFWAGFAALGAGLIYLAVIQEHLSEGLVARFVLRRPRCAADRMGRICLVQ
jgi:hypothetical protein